MAIIVNDTLISNVADNLKAAMTTDPKLREAVQQHIREALFSARREVMSAFPAENGDPRQSARAIRITVYEKVLGGNINILNGKKAHGSINYEPPRNLRPGQRGGNRRTRSERTKKIQGYAPLDRGFILRFVNSGTDVRYAGFGRNGKTQAQKDKFVNDHVGRGNRGSIAPRNWFTSASERALGQALNNIVEMINIEAAAIANGEK